MRPTEVDHVRLAYSLFDEVLAPLACDKRQAGASPYFPAGPDPTAASYFLPSPVRKMTPTEFQFPGGGSASGLIADLAKHWSEEGEVVLAAITPRLTAIADALSQAAASQDGSIDIFCYTLF
ncbi:MAG: hypothetical protein H0X25_07230 [Acidobacteriales bacterium]|nr:hypothetical protein [Terriglobales bacterium]